MTLKFYVKNQTLVQHEHAQPASGSKNYLYAEFKFSREWTGIAKTAVFESSDGTRRYHMLLENGRCAVPTEVIADGGFYLSVFGGNRITSTRIYINVSDSGVTDGLTPPEPTDDIYDQIVDKIDTLQTAVDNISLELPDNSVTTDKLADYSVTDDKIADYAIYPIHLSEQVNNVLHKHANQTTLDKITSSNWSKVYSISTDIDKTTSKYMYNMLTDYESAGYYSFTYEVGEFFEIYNNVDDDICQVQYNDDVVWEFSQPIMSDEFYVARITQMPVSTVDERANGKIEIVKAVEWNTNIFDKLYNRICELESDVEKLKQS